MFDTKIALALKNAAVKVFQEHGDVVRSIGCFVDYYGALNDTQINAGIWIGPQGQVTRPDAVIGSMAACLRLLDIIMQRGEQHRLKLRDELEQVSTKLRAIYEQQRQAAVEGTAEEAQDPEPGG